MIIDIAYNPASGQFRQAGLDILAAAFREHGFEPRLAATRPDGVDLPPDTRLVCVYGGDGAVRLVAGALGDRIADVPLCIMPAGTINLIARELGYAKKSREFAGQIAAAWRRGPGSWISSPLVDFVGTPVMACLSIGPDSAAVAHLSPKLKLRIGRYAYGVAALKLLWHWPRQRLNISAELADGSALETAGEAVFLARGRLYAGPFSLSRHARISSETFELVVMKKAGRLRFAAFGLAVMLGFSTDRLGLSRTWPVRAVQFGDCRLPVQIDGDCTGPCSGRAALRGPVVRYCI